ncbi:hypothetical protein ACMFMF_002215 [Clarireedia jacksonii]
MLSWMKGYIEGYKYAWAARDVDGASEYIDSIYFYPDSNPAQFDLAYSVVTFQSSVSFQNRKLKMPSSRHSKDDPLPFGIRPKGAKVTGADLLEITSQLSGEEKGTLHKADVHGLEKEKKNKEKKSGTEESTLGSTENTISFSVPRSGRTSEQGSQKRGKSRSATRRSQRG